ncbi:MAG TPA: DUF3352 domain-containing protein [Solirubrobacterales bacterium]|nr:DUF3352 domain-containing protein [Solirubrobacterales bacterium]
MKLRLVLPGAALAAALAFAGCGGGSGSGPDPATVMPANASVYVEADLSPGGEVTADLNALAKSVFGIDDLGEYIVTEINDAASDSEEPFDYQQDVASWLGDRAGLVLSGYDGDDFQGGSIAIPSTDTAATQAYIDKATAGDDEPAEEGSYEGIDYKVDPDNGEVYGVVGDFFVFAQEEPSFKSVVDASNGEPLAEVDGFTEAMGALPSGSVGDLYVDIGALVEESGEELDSDAETFLEVSGLEYEDTTLVASVVPEADRIVVELSTDASGKKPFGGDASKALAALPASSLAALSSSELGQRVSIAFNRLDAEGDEEIAPHELKEIYKEQFGIDIDQLTASIGEAGAFIEGSSEETLTGALVLDMKSAAEAANTVANVGLLLRATGVEGFTAVGGNASGFSVRNSDLGRQPLVVLAKDKRLVVGYGKATAEAALAGKGSTLGDSPLYKEAVAALGETPIAAYIDGSRALQLAASSLSDDDDFQEAEPYLEKIAYLALGSAPEGDRTAAKLIVGFEK